MIDLDAGTADEGDAQRLMAGLSLYSTSLAGLLLLVDNRINRCVLAMIILLLAIGDVFHSRIPPRTSKSLSWALCVCHCRWDCVCGDVVGIVLSWGLCMCHCRGDCVCGDVVWGEAPMETYVDVPMLLASLV